MRIAADGFVFEFPDAIDAFVFDEKDKSKPHFHGLSHAMKGVDLVVELPNDFLFIEMKDFNAPDDYDFNNTLDSSEKELRSERVKHLIDVLIRKYRDTWIYRWAETPVEASSKKIRYLCVLTLDNALVNYLSKQLYTRLPLGAAGPRWTREIANTCTVLNPARWNSAFPAWTLERGDE